MSFLFKSSKKGSGYGMPNALPPATREIRSSDGLQGSQIPTPNGSLNGIVKPTSPPPGNGSVNNSLSSLNGNEKIPARNSPMDTDGMRASGPPSPEQKSLRERSTDSGQRTPIARGPSSSSDASPYPWSQRRLNFTVSHTNPFPRYGAAVNATASKDGSIYLMGGLINGSTVKGDLWMVEVGPGNLSCFPIATTSEGPGPRVGHASLLVGNAFIVFGGDTKMDEGDILDDTLYLLNTSTKQWSRALPAGPRPPGRYGHTLNILGSKIYIFGGQVEGYFFNDLVAFDLNALQQASNRWEILIQNTIDGGPPHGQIPPARTNHSMISCGDQLYLFGGTDGVRWFNDVWTYTPRTNSWTQLDCIGYIPSPREGHAAALVGDVMYIFGGRTEEGNDLGDLAAFRITSRRWYTFQNMGPSPSPRSGHSMTTVGKQIVVLAGEPSSAPRDPVELGLAYCLDTGKIRYPPDVATPQPPVNNPAQLQRRPSGDKVGTPVTARAPPPQQQQPQPPRELMERERSSSGGDARARSESVSKLPRPGQQGQLPAPSGPPPQQQPPQPRTNGAPSARRPSGPERAFSPTNDTERAQRFEGRALASPTPRDATVPITRNVISPTFGENQTYFDGGEQPKRQKPETYQPSQDQSETAVVRNSSSRNQRPKMDLEPLDETPRQSIDQPDQTPKVRQLQREENEGPQDSGIGSSPALTQQYDVLMKELDQVKQKNAWYASELALARKSGYQTRETDSPAFDEHAMDVFGEDDKPLIEALLKMRAELSRVQSTIEEQNKSAAGRIAQMEKQRDTAIHEAVFARAKLAGKGADVEGRRGSPDVERNGDINKRLAVALAAQTDLNRRIDGLTKELETERRSRQLAEETAEAAQKRVTELDMRRQEHSSELESLRSELHDAQKEAREASANHADILTQHKLLTVDKDELNGRLERSMTETENHDSILVSLKDAVTASTEKAQMFEQKLEQERRERDGLEEKLRRLRAEHEDRTGELETTSRRLRDAEELADKHAKEAETHRSVVLAGFGKVGNREVDPNAATDERVTILHQQVESANALVRQNQAAADAASDKLRRAEERIAGLEAYQEQASREGLAIRKQLQQTMREMQSVHTEKSELETKLQSQQLETNALAVQHGALKDILGERGINPTDVRRSRVLDSPSSLTRFSTPDLQRVKELEQQLEASLKSHDDMKSQFEEVTMRDDKMKREYEDKLTALDNDHQAAVKYLRGTEKMLSKMKQELQRVKNENGDLRKKLDKARADSAENSKRATPEVPADWETEREKLRREVEQAQADLSTSVSELEGRIATISSQLQTAEGELAQTKSAHATSQKDFTSLQSSHTQTRADIERLQRENGQLEERARDAENKVQLLLDQVEHSVDNYRRQSRVSEGNAPTANGTSFSAGHARNLSNISTSTANPIQNPGGAGGSTHSRNQSDAGESTYSQSGEPMSAGGADGRNSLALDSLASELDALRSHWETTNKNYRLSDKFDFDRTPTNSAHPARENAMSGEFGALQNWRRGLDLEDEDDRSRPGTAEGPKSANGANAGVHASREVVSPGGGMI